MSARSSPSLAAGHRIAERYVVTSHLGSGGMGDVYEVEHALLHKRFALKRLSAEMSADRHMVERFLREARAAAATGHPGIVDVVDLGFAEDGLPYLVMERLAGENLRRRLERGPLDERGVVKLGRAVLAALGAVHAAGIIHRDIKPENVFLCRDGRVKVLDFGLSHTARVEGRLTQSGAVMGTPLYMSPEQARGDDVDARTDLYAVGAMLYECASGRPPFVATAYSVLVAMILEIKPNPERLESLTPALRDVILASLAKHVDERPADALSMRTALGDAIGLDAEEDDGAGADESMWRSGPGSGETPMVASAPTVRSGPIPSVIADEASAPTMVPGSAPPNPPAPVPVPVPVPDRTTAPYKDPALSPSPSPEPEPVPDREPAVTSAPTVVTRSHRGLIAALVVTATIAAVAVGYLLLRDDAAPPRAAAGPASKPAWQTELERGDLEAAAESIRKAHLRAPDDLDLAGRELLLALIEDRDRAYARAAELDGKRLPILAAAAVAAIHAVERGQPAVGADALTAAEAAVEPGSLDELLWRHARATLWRLGDRFDLARKEWERVLDARPGFSPALDGLLQRLLFLDEVAEARRRFDRFIAAAPEGGNTALLEVEMLIGEQRYHEALELLERMVAANPGQEPEAYQFRGDLRVLLDDPTGAITAYDPIADRFKRDHYVSGALSAAGRTAECAALLRSLIKEFPRDGKTSRLAKVMVDTSLLALETNDAALAADAAGAMAGRDIADGEAPVRNATAFARAVRDQLAGQTPRVEDFPLGDASPLWALLAVRGAGDATALDKIRAVTAPEAVRFGTIPSHIYPALWLERARLEAAVGDKDAALRWVERVVRPRHYDASRGVVIGRALATKAEILTALGRSGEADAVRAQLARLQTKKD